MCRDWGVEGDILAEDGLGNRGVAETIVRKFDICKSTGIIFL